MMTNRIELPRSLHSPSLGELTLSESRFEVAGETFCDCTYEAKVVARDAVQFHIVLNPDFDWPYPENALDKLRMLLAKTETRYAKIDKLDTTKVLELQRDNICELGERAGYSRSGATESMLLTGWTLDSEIHFIDGFRLIYSQHPFYALDLLLEFDSSWIPISAQFDG